MRRFLSPEEKKVHYPFLKFVRGVYQFLKPYKWRFFVASVLKAVITIVGLYPSYAFAVMVSFLSHYSPGQSLNTLWNVLGLWILAVLVRIFGNFLARNIGANVAERVELDAVKRGVSHLFLLDMAWHERENSGNKLKRIQNGGEGLRMTLMLWMNTLIGVGIEFMGIIFIISKFDPIIAGTMALFFITYFIFSSFFNRRTASASYLVGVEDEKLHGLLFEAVSNVRTVKAMSMAQSLKGFISKAVEDLLSKIKVRIFRYQSSSTFLGLWGWMFNLGILIFIIMGITKGRYEIALLILFDSYFGKIWESIGVLSDASRDMAVAKYSIARMNETLAEPVVIDSEENKVPFPRDWKTISLKNVSFSYGKHKVLSNISFDIHRGERIGIVGLSGAGKSTLFKLLLKEYESGKGDIFVDKVPLRKISKTDYFRYVSVVLQETEVFNFSLKENITMVRPEKAADAGLLKRAMHIAHVAEFVRKLPEGIHTLIGERGVKLSGGEKQRLGIARAVFKEPQLLLLDEATSHLDLESEEKIRESLHEFFEQATAVVIAHRLTTIREMDKIILIENGAILEMGNFDELYQKQGRFYELWEKQKL